MVLMFARLPCSHVCCRACVKTHFDTQMSQHLQSQPEYKMRADYHDTRSLLLRELLDRPCERPVDAPHFDCPICAASVLFTPMIAPFHTQAAVTYSKYCGTAIEVELDESRMAEFWSDLRPHILGRV
jgi:hypothetical protein